MHSVSLFSQPILFLFTTFLSKNLTSKSRASRLSKDYFDYQISSPGAAPQADHLVDEDQQSLISCASSSVSVNCTGLKSSRKSRHQATSAGLTSNCLVRFFHFCSTSNAENSERLELIKWLTVYYISFHFLSILSKFFDDFRAHLRYECFQSTSYFVTKCALVVS